MAWPSWPTGSEPERCPVFVRNELVIAASPEVAWQWLARPMLWPNWFASAREVRILAGGRELAVGSRVEWRMLGATIRVEVKVSQPPHLLDWQGGAKGVVAYHAWKLEPHAEGCRVLTEETERGPLPWALRWYLRGALHSAHQQWLESLKVACALGEPPRS